MAADGSNYGNGGPASSGGAAVPSAEHPAQGETTDEGSVDPMIGVIIDSRYKIMSKLGEGGMGEVYACEHIGLKKMRAIKLLRAEIVTNEEAVRRFHQEAQSASSIGHRNIIEIVDIGELPDKRVYMCMEYLEGMAFNDMLKQPLEPVRALNILIQTCDGLSAAHRQNIVHRDMKPENVFVTFKDGQDVPKLLDFGIAKVSGNDGQNNLTRTGTIFGTPFYMAPEQALGQSVDHRADVYSMGVIMYEIFTGTVPFKADSFMAILTQHITTDPKPPDEMAAEHGRTIPPGISEIINCCMRKEPNERYSNMEALKAALVERYRALAGPAMSSYYAAQGSRAMSAQGSAPYAMPSGAQGGALAPTPMPTPMPTPSMHSQPAYGATSAYGMEAAPKKGKGWLVAVLLLLFLGGGGAGGYFYWQSQQDADKGGDAIAGVGDDGNKPEDGTQVDVGTPPEDVTQLDAGTKPEDGTQVDVGTPPEDVTQLDAGTKPEDATDVTPPVEMVTVLINSRPQKAEVFLGSESKGLTPTVVEVPKGTATALVLVKKGYKDKAVVVDGKRKKVTERLRRKRRSGGSSGGDKGHGTSGSDGGKPNPYGDKDKPPDKIEDAMRGHKTTRASTTRTASACSTRATTAAPSRSSPRPATSRHRRCSSSTSAYVTIASARGRRRCGGIARISGKLPTRRTRTR